MSGRQRLIAGGLLSLTVVAVGAVVTASLGGGRAFPSLGWWRRAASDGSALERLGVYGEVPDFALTERSGRAVRRADLLGRVWLANFIYTQCRETCPLQSAEVARLQAQFVREADLRFVSITVDPEHDTPAVLARYAEQYGADPAPWWFVTGDRRGIYRLATDGFHLGVVDPDDPAPAATSWLRGLTPAPAFATHGSKGLVMHSARFVLVDRRGRIRAYHLAEDASASPERVRENLRMLLREGSGGA